MLSNLEGKNDLLATQVDDRGQRVIDGWDGIVRILDVNHRTIYSCDATNAACLDSRLHDWLGGCCLCGWLLFGFGHVLSFS